MALQPKVFSKEIHEIFYLMAGRRVIGTKTVMVDDEEVEVYETELILNEEGVWVYEPSNDEEFIDAFAQSYDTYAKDGVINDLDNNGGDYSIISDALKTVSSLGGNGASVLAQALAQYWSGVAVETGRPAHGGNAVTGIVNDALSKQGAFITAITGSYTTDVKTPPFKEFIENVEVVVKTITWTITESFPNGVLKDFTEKIS